MLRWRYLILLIWAFAWFVPPYVHYMHVLTDWNEFEYAARSLVNLQGHYPDGFHVYAREPEMQFGPPPIFALAAFQGFAPNSVALGFALFMVLVGIATLALSESMFAQLQAGACAVRRRRVALIGGMALMAVWSPSIAKFRHLDDVLAIGLTIAAMALIQRNPKFAWWLAALFVGLAVASKPWALGAAPVLGALPRERRSHAVLLALAAVAACYAPFVLVDHSTISALDGYRLYIDPRSTLHLLGVHAVVAPAWVRNVQIGLSFVVSLVLVSKGRWMYVPLVAFAIRVVLDPQAWLYYGLGPIVGALLLDLDRGNKLPWWTLATAGVEGLVPTEWPAAGGWIRLVWFVAIIGTLLTGQRGFDRIAGRLGLLPWRRRMTSRTA